MEDTAQRIVGTWRLVHSVRINPVSALLVLLVPLDVFLTVLSGASAPAIGDRLARLTWRLFRWMFRLFGRPRTDGYERQELRHGKAAGKNCGRHRCIQGNRRIHCAILGC
ncbi:hypothetical protein [Methylocaldum sp.]|uniref:hypothetical protein n=1 Tax=Methylocaldum sp. TaxID=1969727 RepID=UPI002D5589D5|nr:hypothetical protein [Methylocaldum sp.]HYE37526.1 hypothetical protein [Methylocaldum sp.]